MIYPNNFEEKIGFREIRTLLRQHCLSTLGKERVETMSISYDADTINEWFMQTAEFRRLQDTEELFPLQFFFDLRESISRIRLDGTHLEESELFDLRRSLETVSGITAIFDKCTDENIYIYPTLHLLTSDAFTFPELIRRIDQILDKYGKIKDSASPALANVRQQLSRTQGSISRTLFSILRSAQAEGLVDKDVAPTMRDGRLVIPIAPGVKRKVRGIVHDESATGKTVYVEPTEVVEANNRIRELEAEELREILRILTEFTKLVRPHVREILSSYRFLGIVDFIRAKAEFARLVNGIEPKVDNRPQLDWIRAIHPLLQSSLQKQCKSIIPLDITLTEENRILIISGPNAGGKSVCLKTVGLLQYMLQCGISVPFSERSTAGIFKDIMIDIGDEQSIENDLSTYSSHLANMKCMMRQANDATILLIDEFGTGTEPQIGGAIAEAVLKQFCQKKAYGVITTHYQNLKHYADSHPGVVNAAMLYDRHEMRPLFQLAIGQPGSSFAIEIARKTGLPEAVIRDASEIVGSEYIQSDKYLQDIVRDKRYWEGKRQSIHQREKDLERIISKYESDVKELDTKRRDIMRQAKEQAEDLISQSNRKIENVIKEIREKQAEKESTKRIREDLALFKEAVSATDAQNKDELIARKMKQIEERRQRREKRKKEKAENKIQNPSPASTANAMRKDSTTFCVGDTVRIKGMTTVGHIEEISGDKATVIFGDMRTKMQTKRLEAAQAPLSTTSRQTSISRETRQTIDNRRENFHQDLDVRGMRGDEALHAVTYFIDDAILVGMPRVRILHGKGNGILRQLIRQYLATVPGVSSFRDEHVQFGGAGITIVDID